MQNLDKYFKENLEGRQFEMKDAYWGQAEKMLAEEERRRRWGVWFWWGGAGLAAAVLAALFFVFPSEKTDGEIAGNSGDSSIPKIENNIPDENEDETAREELNEKSETELNKQNERAGSNLRGDKINENAKNLIQKNIVSERGNSKKRKVEKTVFENKEANFLTIKNNNAQRQNGLENNDLEANKNTFGKFEKINKNTDEEKTMEADNLIRETAPAALATLPFFVKKEDEKPHLKTANVKLRPGSKWGLSFTAAQLFQPILRSDEKPAIAFRAGILLRRNLGGRNGFYLAGGLQYQRRTGTFGQSKLAENRNYRFGLELDTSLLRPSSLHTLSLPVLLGRERGRHLAEAGLSLDYLMGVRGERGGIERIPESSPPRRGFVPAESGWIVEDGFQKWTATAQLNYRFRMNAQWSFGLSANYTFGSILEKINNELPGVGVELKEDDKFYFGVQAVYLLQK